MDVEALMDVVFVTYKKNRIKATIQIYNEIVFANDQILRCFHVFIHTWEY